MCEHAFVTTQGSPLTRMRRAIRLGSVEVALLAAGELNHVGLDDALGLCLLLRGIAATSRQREGGWCAS